MPHVKTKPERVSATENWEPHSTLIAPANDDPIVIIGLKLIMIACKAFLVCVPKLFLLFALWVVRGQVAGMA